MFFELFEEDTAGLRPAPLADVQPQARLEAPRAAVVDSWLPLVQVLDLTVPQNVDDEVMALYITKHVAVVMVGVPELVEPFSGVHRGGLATVQMVEELEHAHAPSPLRSSFSWCWSWCLSECSAAPFLRGRVDSGAGCLYSGFIGSGACRRFSRSTRCCAKCGADRRHSRSCGAVFWHFWFLAW